MSIISVKSIFLVSLLSILRTARSFSLSCIIVLCIKFLMFNLLNERSADATVTGRVAEDYHGHARVLKYLNKVKSSHRHRLKEFLTKLISDKFGRVCQLSIKCMLSVAFTSDCNHGPRGSCPGYPPLGTPVYYYKYYHHIYYYIYYHHIYYRTTAHCDKLFFLTSFNYSVENVTVTNKSYNGNSYKKPCEISTNLRNHSHVQECSPIKTIEMTYTAK